MAETSQKQNNNKEQLVASVRPEPGPESPSQTEPELKKGSLLMLCLTSLGVVYGDIGTSPLYALRECFRHQGTAGSLVPNTGNVLGVLSLIFWALILVISVKYLVYVKGENEGEL